MSNNAVMLHVFDEDKRCCRLFVASMQQTQRGFLACVLTDLNRLSAKLMQQHASVELQSRSRAKIQVEDCALLFCCKSQLFPGGCRITIQVSDVAITVEGRRLGREGRGAAAMLP